MPARDHPRGAQSGQLEQPGGRAAERVGAGARTRAGHLRGGHQPSRRDGAPAAHSGTYDRHLHHDRTRTRGELPRRYRQGPGEGEALHQQPRTGLLPRPCRRACRRAGQRAGQAVGTAGLEPGEQRVCTRVRRGAPRGTHRAAAASRPRGRHLPPALHRQGLGGERPACDHPAPSPRSFPRMDRRAGARSHPGGHAAGNARWHP